MKTVTVLLMMSFSLLAFANQGELVIHGNFEDDKYCSLQIRNLDCGDVDAPEFNSCVNKRISELEPKCQDYHLDEMERQLDAKYSKPNN